MANPTLAELRSDLIARGHDYLTNDRLDAAINAAYNELANLYEWPFLETTQTFNNPVEISGIRKLINVQRYDDTGGLVNLTYVDWNAYVRSGADVSAVGPGQVYGMEGDTVRVSPLSDTEDFLIRYVKSPTELINATDEVDIPRRYKRVLVDGANIWALKEDSNYEAIAALRAEWDRSVQQMYTSAFKRQNNTRYIQVNHADDWDWGRC